MASHNIDTNTAISLLRTKDLNKVQASNLYSATQTKIALEQQIQQEQKVIDQHNKFSNLLANTTTLAKSVLATTALSLTFSLASKGIGFAIGQLDQWIHRNEIAIEKSNKAKAAIHQVNQAFQANKTAIDKAIASYDRLATGVRTTGNTIENLSLSNEDFETFLELNNQLAQISPSLIANVDKNGNAILNLGTQGRTASEDLQELLNAQEQLANYNTFTQLGTLFTGTNNQLNGTNEALEKNRQELDAYENYFDMVNTKIAADHQTHSFNIDTKAGEEYYSVMSEAFKSFYKNLSKERKYELPLVSPEYFLRPDPNNDRVYEVLLEASQLTPGELDELNKQIALQAKEVAYNVNDAYNIEKHLQSNNSTANKLVWKDFLFNLASAAKSQSSFSDLDEPLQEIADFMITSLPEKIAKDMNPDKPYDYILTNIVSKLSDLSDAEAKDLSSAYSDLFHFDTTGLAPDEIEKSIKPALDRVNKYLSNEQTLAIKTRLDYIPDQENVHAYNQAMLHASQKFSNIPATSGAAKSNSPADHIGSYVKEITSYSKATHVEYKALEDFVRENNIQSKASIEYWNQCLDQSKSAQEAMDKYTRQQNLELALSDHTAASISNLSQAVSISSAAIEEHTANGAISVETWNSLKDALPGVDSAMVRTASGIKLNTEVLQQLNTEQAKASKADLERDRQALSEHYTEQSAVLASYMIRLRDTNSLTDTQRQELEALVSVQNASLDSTAAKIADLEILGGQLDRVTSKYNIFKTALNSTDSSSEYEYMVSMKGRIDSVIANGDYGKDDYRAFIDYFTSTDMSNASINDLKAAESKASDLYNTYFTGDEAPQKFMDKITTLSGVTVEQSENGPVLMIQDIQQAADELGGSLDLLEAGLGLFKDKGYAIDGVYTNIDDPAAKLQYLYDELETAEIQLGQTSPNIDTSELKQHIDDIKAEISTLESNITPYISEEDVKQQIIKLQEEIDSIDVSVSSANINRVDELKRQQQELSQEHGLDLSVVLSTEPDTIPQFIQDTKDLINGLLIPQTIPIAADDNGSIQAIDEALNTLTSKTRTVHVNVASSYGGSLLPSISGLPGGKKTLPNHTAAGWQGSAFAQGSWNIGRTGKSLVGELGRELVVRGSRYFTVGDNGAEFVPLKSNDIIFNHRQTDALLNYGKINSRGKAYASGSADDFEIDWIERKIKLENDRSNLLQKNASSPAISYLGLTAAELEHAKAIIESTDGILQSDMQQLQDMAKAAGISLSELFLIIQNGGYTESRRSYLSQIIESDERQLINYEEAIARYQADYEALISELAPEMQKKIEEGDISVDNLSEDERKKVEQAIDAFDKVQKYKIKKREEELKQLEHIKEYYDNEIEYLEMQAERIQSSTALIKAQLNYLKESGQVINASSYQQLIDNNKREAAIVEKRIALRKAELATLMNSHGYDENSADVLALDKEISALELAGQQLAMTNEQLRNDLLHLPIENLDIILSMYDSIIDTIQRFGSELEASGRKLDRQYYQTLINNGMTILDQYREQADLVREVMDEYEAGSDNWNTLYNKLQNINSAMSSMVQNLHKWNEALLQMPIDSVGEFSDQLQKALKAMNALRSDYDTVISAVTDAVQKEIDLLNESRDDHTDQLDAEIDVLKERLELLNKQNEALRVQSAYEQALYDLQTANTQKTERVIRNGEIVYETNADNLRNAEQSLQDALANLNRYDLEKEMEALQDELTAVNDRYSEQIESLEKISRKWSEISDKIQTAKNDALASEILGNGWKDTIISGNDDALFSMFSGMYQAISGQIDQYENQIEATDNILALLQDYLVAYKQGTITYDQAAAGISGLLSQINEKMSAADNLNNILDFLSTSTGAGDDAGSILAAVKDSLVKTGAELVASLEQYNENASLISDYTTSWQQLTSDVSDIKSILKDVRRNLKEALDQVENIENDLDQDDDAPLGSGSGVGSGIGSIIGGIIGGIVGGSNGAAIGGSIGSTIGGRGPGSSGSSSSGSRPSGSSSSNGGKSNVITSGRNDYSNSGPGVRYDGIKSGLIGSSNDTRREQLLRLFSTQNIPDRAHAVPIIAHEGEAVLNREQQSTLLDNLASAWNYTPSLGLPSYAAFTADSGRQAASSFTFGDIRIERCDNPDQLAEGILKGGLTAAIRHQIGRYN